MDVHSVLEAELASEREVRMSSQAYIATLRKAVANLLENGDAKLMENTTGDTSANGDDVLKLLRVGPGQ
jgi:hypothetical protein